MAKQVWVVALEAAVVGTVLALMMLAATWKFDVAMWAFLCGALFHIGCEVFLINKWYVDNYDVRH
jgi:hypothetical protein